MSTTTEPIVEIADESEVTVSGGGKAWRFANGKIVRGPERDDQPGTYTEEREKIVGILQRVGIYDGVGKTDQAPYKQLEADIETSDGLVHVKASLSDPDSPGSLKPSVSTVKFAWGLTQFKKGEQVMITAERSKDRVTLPNGRQGGYVTYVNFARVERKIVKVDGQEQSKFVATPVYSPRRGPNEAKKNLTEQWLELEPSIRAHDAFAERATSFDDDEDAGKTHFAELCQECLNRGWPTPEQAPADWLVLLSKLFGEQEARKALSDWTEDEWGDVRQSFIARAEKEGVEPDKQSLPKSLEAAAKRLKKAEKAAPAEKEAFEDI